MMPDTIRNAATLDELLAAILAYRAEVRSHLEDDDSDRWMPDLPTFGSEEPSDTSGVWSWDAKRLLVSTGCEPGYRIIEREAESYEDARRYAPARCECGDVYGEACEAEVAEGERVTIEWMPAHLRASHLSSGNRGVYPANGAQRITCCRECADRILESEADWASEVES